MATVFRAQKNNIAHYFNNYLFYLCLPILDIFKELYYPTSSFMLPCLKYVLNQITHYLYPSSSYDKERKEKENKKR